MMPDGPIHLRRRTTPRRRIKAAGSARRYTLRGMPGDDFPPLPAPGRRLAVARARRRRAPGADRQDALLDLERRDPRAPELGALRVGRRRRADGHDRRASALEDGGQGQRAGRPRRRCSFRSRPSRSSGACATTLSGRDGKEGGAKAAAPDHAERIERVLPGRRHDVRACASSTRSFRRTRRSFRSRARRSCASREPPSPTRCAPSRSPRASARAA